MTELVSILIPCYNAKRWIAQAIESALSQTWPKKEVIVIDDGSTDGSLAVIRQYDDRIRWEAGTNRGSNAARNRLLELSKGSWLQYLDADDWLMPEKIADQMAFLESKPSVDIVYGPSILEHWSEKSVRHEYLNIPEPRDPWVLLARWFLPQTGAPLWRKQAIVDVSGWKEDQPCCQEHELYLRLLMAGKRFSYCNVAGAIYRQWSNQTVCRRDVSLVNRQRLEIERRAETYLAARAQLSSDRLQAINTARLEIARGAWQANPDFARGIVRTIFESQPTFKPCDSAASPLLYRLAFNALGFVGTERVARSTRALRRCMSWQQHNPLGQ